MSAIFLNLVIYAATALVMFVVIRLAVLSALRAHDREQRRRAD